MFPDKPTNETVLDVYDLNGNFVIHLDIAGQNKLCWSTAGVPPGLYSVRMKLSYSDGSSGTTWQKVVLAR